MDSNGAPHSESGREREKDRERTGGEGSKKKGLYLLLIQHLLLQFFHHLALLVNLIILNTHRQQRQPDSTSRFLNEHNLCLLFTCIQASRCKSVLTCLLGSMALCLTIHKNRMCQYVHKVVICCYIFILCTVSISTHQYKIFINIYKI